MLGARTTGHGANPGPATSSRQPNNQHSNSSKRPTGIVHKLTDISLPRSMPAWHSHSYASRDWPSTHHRRQFATNECILDTSTLCHWHLGRALQVSVIDKSSCHCTESTAAAMLPWRCTVLLQVLYNSQEIIRAPPPTNSSITQSSVQHMYNHNSIKAACSTFEHHSCRHSRFTDSSSSHIKAVGVATSSTSVSCASQQHMCTCELQAQTAPKRYR
jgi:hypothetical protein